MKLLFDFISIQGFINGGAEYTKRILLEISKTVDSRKIELQALYDSKLSFIGDDRVEYGCCFNKWVNINKISSIGEYCTEECIDVLFIGIGQRYYRYNLDNINCRTIVVFHDICSVELERCVMGIKDHHLTMSNKIKHLGHKLLYKLNMTNIGLTQSQEIMTKKSFWEKKNVEIITVSNFSKLSLQYNFPFFREKEIKVFYSPLRKAKELRENPIVKDLVNKKKKYFVALNSDRVVKNSRMAIAAVRRFCEEHSDYVIVTTGGLPSQNQFHIGLGYIDESELAYILSNAEALIYPTFIEGFGYPPVEAMSYGTPVICSNCTSIPEVVGDAAIYFNPLFETELFAALLKYYKSDKNKLKEKCLEQYNIIQAKQTGDLERMVDYILRNI